MIANVFTLAGLSGVSSFTAVYAFLRAVAAIKVRTFVLVFRGAQGSMLRVVVFASTDGTTQSIDGSFTFVDVVGCTPASATLFR